jgi:hypothetical protein
LQDAMRKVAGNATEAVQSAAEQSQSSIEAIASRSAATADNVSSVMQNAFGREEVRDKVLLGAAGVAVLAALGMAYERRNSEMADEVDE